MPAEGIEFRPPEELLQDDELLLLVRVAAELGVTKVRLTGGEPTVRPGLVELVQKISGISGIEDIAITTNGLLLEYLAAPLAEAGLSRGSMLYEEAYFLLQTELREASRYHAALSVLASGATRHQDVARAIFGPEGRASAQPYLNRLEGLGMVERVVPATARNPQRTRDAIYRISDPFLRFWFRSAAPNRSALKQGRARDVWAQRILPVLSENMGSVFEECARAHTWHLARAGQLPFQPDTVGSWWDGKEEINVTAVRHSTKETFLAECTWSTGAAHPRELDELQRKTAYFQTRTGYVSRGLTLYARRQFSQPVARKAQEMGVALYTVADLY